MKKAEEGPTYIEWLKEELKKGLKQIETAEDEDIKLSQFSKWQLSDQQSSDVESSASSVKSPPPKQPFRVIKRAQK